MLGIRIEQKKDKLIYVGLYLFFTILLIATYFLEITK